MDQETSRQLMTEQLDVVRASALSKAFGWVIDEDGLIAYVTLKPRKRPGESFVLRVCFRDFNRRAPSYVFVDTESHQPGDSAWPPGVRHGAAPPGICTPGTRECHEHYHANDRQYEWRPDRRSVLRTITEIHRMMDRSFN
jgi:hypothetical protein